MAGLSRRGLWAAALFESAIATALGISAGLVAGRLLATVFGLWEPRFLTLIPPWLAADVALGAGALALVATVLPLRALGRVTPVPAAG